jgi:hypothetical protein
LTTDYDFAQSMAFFMAATESLMRREPPSHQPKAFIFFEIGVCGCGTFGELCLPFIFNGIVINYLSYAIIVDYLWKFN